MATGTAAILGLDTAAGAYLARLLGARGFAVRGTGGPDLLDRLGIARDVVRFDNVVAAVTGADHVYDLRGEPAAIPVLLARCGSSRVFVAVEPHDTVTIAALAAAREGAFVATGRVYPHESRLGPGTSPVARIVAALHGGHAPDPADLATSTDCGWTAELVDAMARMLERPAPDDLVIATGHVLAGTEVARIAAAYFGRPVPADVAPQGSATPGDPAAARAALGWRAVTTGAELVTVLCEGAADG